MLVVIAQYRAAPGAGDDVAALLARHVPLTQAEPGCVCFFANRSADEPDRFVLYEQYTDEAAFQAHRASSHFRQYIEGAIVPMLAERTWARYELVE